MWIKPYGTVDDITSQLKLFADDSLFYGVVHNAMDVLTFQT